MNPVAADDYVGGQELTTVQEGTVSGGIYIDTYYGFDPATPKNVNHDFKPLPDDAEVVNATLYTGIYCGNMQADRPVNLSVTFNGQLIANEYLSSIYTFPGEGGTGTVELNDHINRVTSDYLLWYDVTHLMQQNNVVNVDTSSTVFDGRIRFISLIAAYNDGSAKEIQYWINQGHDVHSYYDEHYEGTTTFTSNLARNIGKAQLQIIHLSSQDGTYDFNNQILPSGTPQGSLSGSNIWDVTNIYHSHGINTLNYKRTGNFFKIVLAVLTVQLEEESVVVLPDLLPTNLQVTTPLYVNENHQVRVTINNIGSAAGNFAVSFSANDNLVDIKNISGLDSGSTIDLNFKWTPTSGGQYLLQVVVDPDNLVTESNKNNNHITKTVEAILKLPDLVVNSINTPSNMELGNNYQITVNISNIGSLDSSEGALALYKGSTLLGIHPLGNTVPGQSYNFNFTWTPLNLGENILRAVIDPENVVKESNKDNNQLSRVVIIKDHTVLNIFLISDNPGSAVLNMAAQEILDLYPGLFSIQIRSNNQINNMSESEFRSYLESCDIFIGNWLSSQVNLKIVNILKENPEIATNKLVFLILETDVANVELMKKSTINGVKLLENYNISQLSDYRSKTSRGTNFNDIVAYLETVSFPAPYNTATLYKSVEDKLNAKNQILWALNKAGFTTNYQNPQFSGDTLEYGIYRYRWYSDLAEYMGDYFQEGRPSVGLIESTAYLRSQNLGVYYEIIAQLESRGLNVIPVLAAGGTTDQLKVMVESFTSAPDAESFLENPSQYQTYVDAIIQMQAYGLGGESFTDTTEFFIKLNAPLIRAIHSDYMSNEDWELSNEGLSTVSGDRWWHITILEAQGIIEPTFIGGKSSTIDPRTGVEIIGYIPQMENIHRMVDRIKNWVALKYMPNSDKVVALIYFNYPVGKQNIGASYLDVVSSIYNLLYAFQEEGYTLENLPNSVEDLLNLMLNQGINVANWAPGEVEKMANNPEVVLFPVSEYLQWFHNLDPLTQKWVVEGPTAYIGQIAQRAVELGKGTDMFKTLEAWEAEVLAFLPRNKIFATTIIKDITLALKNYLQTHNEVYYGEYLSLQKDFMALNIEGLSGWGEAPGNIMTVQKDGNNYFLLPGIKFGNIFIGPQPQRGWEGDLDQLYHNSRVPPHHQYLAFYAYLQKINTDAMVHMGRHATNEWLPGKEVVLASTDFPSIITGNIPHINYYIIDGLAEGIQVKRRGWGVIIDHLTPPMSFTKLYGGLSLMAKLIDEYEDTYDLSRRQEIVDEVRTIISNNNLEVDIGGDLDVLSNDDLIDRVDDYLWDVQSTLFPYGLHVIGEPWSDEKISLLVTSMLSVPFDVEDGSRSITLQDQVALILYGKTFRECNAQEVDEVQGKSVEIVTALIHSQANTVALNFTSNPSNDFLLSLDKAAEYIQAIQFSLLNEVNSLFNALRGGYVPPGPGVEPVTNPNALPTGKNFFHDQASEIPTRRAYEYGGELALLALQSMDEDTNRIVVGIWCVETARDDGALVAMVMHLLGMEPQWSSSPSAGPNGQKLREMPAYLELDQLIRPEGWQNKRIDVVVITSGLFRDIYNRQSVLLDKSFRIALARSYYTILNDQNLQAKYGNQLKESLDKVLLTVGYYGLGNEPLSHNFVAQNWVEDFQYFMDQGMSSDLAGEMAIVRIFAPPTGDYGAGISKAAELSWTMEDRMEMADFYLRRMGNIYTENNWGLSNPLVFQRALTNVGTIFTSRNTHLYGVLDNDDFFDYWGGLSLAMERVNQKTPNMFVLRYADRDNPNVMSLENFLNRETTTRYYNPSWVQGMMGHGYSGSRQISQKFLENLWGWQITRPGAVQNWMWDEVVNVYLNDKYNIGVSGWLSSEHNVYSMISITGSLLSASQKGYWSTDASTLSSVANTWANHVHQHGVSCDHHTCGDVAMVQWAMQYIDSGILSQFKQVMYQATGNAVFAPGSVGSTTPGGITTGPVGPTPGTGGTSPGTGGASPGTAPEGQSDGSNSAGDSSQSSASASDQSMGDAALDSAGQDIVGEGAGAQAHEVNRLHKVQEIVEDVPYAPLVVLLLIAFLALGYFKGIK